MLDTSYDTNIWGQGVYELQSNMILKITEVRTGDTSVYVVASL